MEKSFIWKKSFLSRTYDIFYQDLHAGSIKESFWGSRAEGEMDGKIWLFVTKGCFKRRTEIIDPGSDHLVATIIYGTIGWKASIIFADNPERIVTWRFTNFWNTKWSLTCQSAETIEYKGMTSKGTIVSNINDDMLILAGLFIVSYFRRTTATAAGA